jgi:predicted 2-oxoglutarate/Fe(II)-dependent dioxygenase YbiX
LASLFDTPLDIQRTARCFCGSGARFKHCCGSSDPDRAPPHGVLLRPGFLDPATCREWVALLEAQPRAWLDVVDHEQSTPERIVRRPDPSRVTEKIEPGALREPIDALVRRAFVEVAAPWFDCRLAWFEQPTVLRYTPGGKYDEHADADVWEGDGPPRRVLDRDVSLLLYLGEDFSGGELAFPNFDWRLRPRAGLLVAFPSDERYAHAALPLESGVRHAIVSWAHAIGRPRVRPAPPSDAIALAE